MAHAVHVRPKDDVLRRGFSFRRLVLHASASEAASLRTYRAIYRHERPQCRVSADLDVL